MNKRDHLKYYADENVIRLIAAEVIIITTISVWQHWIVMLLLLTLDFAIRAFTYLPSPLTALAKIVADLLKLKPKPIYAAPKKFAAGIGFLFSSVILILSYLEICLGAYLLTGVLVVFAFLESVFKICTGCYIYNFIIVPIDNSRNNKNDKTN